MKTIGVISDTHGVLRPEAVKALRGVDLIIHAGDVGRSDILDELRQIAPVFAVRGNTDYEAWAWTLPLTERVQADQHLIFVLHDVYQLGLTPRCMVSRPSSAVTRTSPPSRRNAACYTSIPQCRSATFSFAR